MNPKKVLLVDKFPPSVIDRLQSSGLQVDYRPDAGTEGLKTALPGVSILSVRSTKVTADALGSADSLQLIIRAGAGTDTIDVPAASRVGIYVANCPGKNAVAVAELAMGLLLAADRRIPQATADLRAGKWDKKEYAKAAGLHGRTLGVLGVGTIGTLVLARARAFGMKVAAWSRSLTPEQAGALGAERCGSPADLAARADAVSIHLALSADTHHLVGKEFLAAMKPGAILVNTSRGELVDSAAVAEAVRTRGIRFAADVLEGEPTAAQASFDHPLLKTPGFIGTPHIGASTEQAQEATGDEVVRIILEFLGGGAAPNTVNLARHTPAKFLLVVRHYDRVGVLAGIFDLLRRAGINVQRTSNVVFEGAEAAVARVELDKDPGGETVKMLRKAEHVLSVDLVELSES